MTAIIRENWIKLKLQALYKLTEGETLKFLIHHLWLKTVQFYKNIEIES